MSPVAAGALEEVDACLFLVHWPLQTGQGVFSCCQQLLLSVQFVCYQAGLTGVPKTTGKEVGPFHLEINLLLWCSGLSALYIVSFPASVSQPFSPCAGSFGAASGWGTAAVTSKGVLVCVLPGERGPVSVSLWEALVRIPPLSRGVGGHILPQVGRWLAVELRTRMLVQPK